MDGANPIAWRVLDASKTNTGADGAFLLSEGVLPSGACKFNDWSGSQTIAYPSSNARQVLETNTDSVRKTLFSNLEQGAMLETTTTSDSLNADKLFLLSFDEAYTSAYFTVDSVTPRLASEDRVVKDGSDVPQWWWLRSIDGYPFVYGVNSDGAVCRGLYANMEFYLRPAFNLIPTSVLFTSAEGGKDASGMGSGLAAVGKNTADYWKLTLKDSGRDGFTIGSPTDNGGLLSIPYTGAATGANEYISAIIKDADGNITHYGRVAQTTNTADASGTAQIDLSDVAIAATDTLYVFSEQYNGEQKTDYASALRAVSVSPPAYTLSAAPETLSFGNSCAGYAQPNAQVVTVTNTGNREITVALPTLANYTIAAVTGFSDGSAALAAGATATFTVQPNPWLSVGPYNGTITVSGSNGSNNASDTVDVTFAVVEPVNVTISGNGSPSEFSIIEGQSIELTANVTGGAEDASYDYAWIVPIPSAPPTWGQFNDPFATTKSVEVSPTADTTYKVGVRDVDNSDNSDIDQVLVTVEEATHGIEVNPASLSFGTVNEGYAQPNPQTVTVTYTGNIGSVTLTQPTSTDYEIGALSRTTLDTTNTTATFTVKPKADLSAGTYTAPIAVDTTPAQSSPLTVEPTFTVNGAFTVGISGNLAIIAGDSTVLTANAAGGSGTYTYQWFKGSETTAFSDANSVTVSPAVTTIYKVVARDAIEDKSAQATVVVEAQTYTITVTPTAYDFGTKSKDYYSRPSAYTYTVTNEGNSNVTLETLTGSAAFEITTPNDWTSTLAPNATRTFTVRPNDGLDTSTYDETFAVSTTQGTSDDFGAKFVVGTRMNVNITGNPSSLEIINGQSIELTANVTGGTEGSSYTYAWTVPVPSAPPVMIPFETTNPVTVSPTKDTTYKVEVTEEDNSRNTATTTVIVKEATHGITVSPASLSFGTVNEGYAQPASQTVTVTYTGNIGSVTLTQPAGTQYYDVGALSRTTLDTTNTTATFTVQPKADLPAGTYAAPIVVDTTPAQSSPLTVEPTFTVKTPVIISVNVNNTAYGSVTGSGTYDENAAVTLTATANGGFHFIQWMENGADVGTANPLIFNATASRTLTAMFGADANPPAIANAILNITEGQSYTQGDTVTFAAVGGGMDNAAPYPNDMRWLPTSWETNPSGTFNTGFTQSFNTADMSLGSHTLTVTFTKQRYIGGAWSDVSPAVIDTKSIGFTLLATPTVLAVTVQPADQHVTEGQHATFSLTATGDGLTYQWYANRNDGRGWEQLNGATGPVYTITAAGLNANGFRYGCRLMDARGQTLDSGVATLYVSSAILPPQTGDSAAPLVWLCLCLLGGMGLLALTFNRRRRA